MNKKIFTVVALVFTVFFAAVIFKTIESKQKAQATIDRENFIADSLAREQYIQDSIQTVKKNNEIIKKYDLLFNKEPDEFNDCVWVSHKDSRKYEHCYCYFQIKEKKAQNFRFFFNYFAHEWLFIKYLIFNFDGNNVTIYPTEINSKVISGDLIKEWFDESISSYSLTSFIEHFTNANVVKVAIYGKDGKSIQNISKEEIESIKNTYEYYLALGGQFE